MSRMTGPAGAVSISNGGALAAYTILKLIGKPVQTSKTYGTSNCREHPETAHLKTCQFRRALMLIVAAWLLGGMSVVTAFAQSPQVLAGTGPFAVKPAAARAITGSFDEFGSCAVVTSGEVECWGEIGVYSRLAAGPVLTPRRLPSAGKVVQVALARHLCVLLVSGSIRCSYLPSYEPTGYGVVRRGKSFWSPPLRMGGRATQLVGNEHGYCAMLVGGTVKCWGINVDGLFGYRGAPRNTNVSPRAPRRRVELGGPAKQLSTAGSSICALLIGGAVKCWGDNNDGQAGIGRYSKPLLVPPRRPVALGGPAIQISQGDASTCVVMAEGGVKCWGGDAIVGYDATGLRHATVEPVEETIPLGAPALEVSTASENSCAVLVGGVLKCWGQNQRLLGWGGPATLTGVRTAFEAPLEVGGPVSAVHVSASAVCVLLTSGQVKCWGEGFGGELGDGSEKTLAAPPVAPVGL
jgi:hypothetical protein